MSDTETGIEATIFAPRWPAELQGNSAYSITCDDARTSGLRLIISRDGDVWVQCHEGAGGDGEKYVHAGIRVRTYHGGGRHTRTHQALLWLARAMQLDRAEGGP